MERRTILICRPVSLGPPGYSVELGTTKDVCFECSREVWVAPSGRRMLDAGGTAYCMACGSMVIAADDDPRFEIAPGSLDELEDVGGPALSRKARRLSERLNRRQ